MTEWKVVASQDGDGINIDVEDDLVLVQVFVSEDVDPVAYFHYEPSIVRGLAQALIAAAEEVEGVDGG